MSGAAGAWPAAAQSPVGLTRLLNPLLPTQLWIVYVVKVLDSFCFFSFSNILTVRPLLATPPRRRQPPTLARAALRSC
jgi:hypothetical protein